MSLDLMKGKALLCVPSILDLGLSPWFIWWKALTLVPSPPPPLPFWDLHKSMITFIFFFTMGKAYEWKALQECNARHRLILNSHHFGNAPTLGLYIGLDILVDDDCHFYYITKIEGKRHWSMLVSQHYGQQLFFGVNDIVIFFKLITKYWTFVLVCPWTRFFFWFF